MAMIGKLDRYVTLYVAQNTKTTGIMETTLVKVKDVWAQRVDGSGKEEFEEKIFTLDNRKYVVHYDTAITAVLQEALVVEDEGRKYYVYASDEIVRGTYIELKGEFRE